MEPSAYAARLARHVDLEVVAACAVRAPGTTVTTALCAGLGAAAGSIGLGGALYAGIGGGLSVIVGYLLVWLRVRRSGMSTAMALVLGPDRLELWRLNAFGTRPAGRWRSIPYAEITGVELRSKLLELGIAITTAESVIRVDGGKRGVGAAPPVVEQLQRRIAA